MIAQGRIYQVFPIQTGTRQDGTEWKKQEYIFEYFEDPKQRFADRVIFSLMNDNIDKYALREGDQLKIGFGHKLHVYNGRYYNDLTIYRFEKLPAHAALFKEELDDCSTQQDGDAPF